MNAPIDITGVTLTTRRLILRPWREQDLEDFYAYARVDGVGQMAGWTPHRDREESRRILTSFIQGRHVFALEYQGKVIGSLGIEEYSEEHYPELSNLAGREIGYVLSKDYWGRGLMPEAVQAVIRYLFDQVTAPRSAPRRASSTEPEEGARLFRPAPSGRVGREVGRRQRANPSSGNCRWK